MSETPRGKKWIVPSFSPLISLNRGLIRMRVISEREAIKWVHTRIWESGIRPRLLAELFGRRLGINISTTPFIPQIRPGDELLIGQIIRPRNITPEIIGNRDALRRVVIRWVVAQVLEE